MNRLVVWWCQQAICLLVPAHLLALQFARLFAVSFAVSFALSFALQANSAPLTPEEIPEVLRPWTEWVLHGHENELCPFLNGTKGSEELGCVWPAKLQLELDGSGGRFNQSWKLYAAAQVPLPGDAKQWPHEVSIDGRPAPVALWQGQPSVLLRPGTHEVDGRFRWNTMPELLAIPPETGIVRLALRGRPVPFPNRDAANRLWLEPRTNSPGDAADRLEIVIQRRVIDEIPLRIDTRVDLRVAGASREAVLGKALPDGFIPMSLSGPLPARLDPDGRLRVQLRPGHWTLNLNARHAGPIDSLSVPTQEEGAVWTTEEIWVFEARPHLRLVDVGGAPIIDPNQTTIPAEWKHLPTYLMGPGARLELTQRRRGDENPADDDLRLSRTWWLDFDGSGYTVVDHIEGNIRRSTRLETKSDFDLGRVTLDEKDQFITKLEASKHAGVEVPLGPVALTAEGRVPDRANLSAVSWDHDFQGLSVELWLPPGWKILHASGVDSASTTWLNRWTLLDLFVVLVAAIASFRLWGFVWGALALAALALVYTEPHAPRWIWIGVLVGEALRRALPEGRFALSIRIFRWLALAGLLYVSLPFAVGQVRIAMHPALERVDSIGPGGFSQNLFAPPESRASIEFDEAKKLGALGHVDEERTEKLAKLALGSAGYDGLIQKFGRYAQDPNAHITTGPGIPSWTWQRIELLWSGPVDRDQPLDLIVVPPRMVSILGFLRVALLAVLVLRFLDIAHGRRNSPLAPWLRRGVAATAVVIAVLVSIAPAARAADIPSEAMLSQLRAGLLEKPECYPDCATISKLLINIADSMLTLRLTVDAAARTAIPLPGGAKSFRPARVSVNGEPATGMLRDPQGILWVELSEGRHEIIARGWLPDRNNFDLPFPLQPHHVTAVASGWEINGLREDGLAESTLQITRNEQTASARLDPGELPPLLEVRRTLVLGLDWTLDTQVLRLTPSDTAVVVEIPLLPGESVTSGHIRVRDGRALVSLQPGSVQAAWQSELEEQSPLELRAAQSLPITEVWRLDVSPIWHVEAHGIPPIHATTNLGARVREWRPWPSEEVVLDIERPAGVGGATVTIDASHLTVTPGLRSTDATLRLDMRSSRGGQHTIVLSRDAELRTVSIDGEDQPIRQEGRNVVLPLLPGKRTIDLVWREPRGLIDGFLYKTPEVKLGIASVNAEVQLLPSAGRWILGLGGAQLGPAVLFWPLLITWVAVSAGLGRLRLSPLRTRHWLLLLIGLTQIPIEGAAIVVTWLLLLGWRSERADTLSSAWFDFVQLLLVGLTFAALCAMYLSIHEGLLGTPQMQISGNGSNSTVLNWYQDRVSNGPPIVWAFSVPVIVYRIAMLFWALWLAQALLRWLRWGWECFCTGAMWRPLRTPPKPHAQVSIPVEPPN